MESEPDAGVRTAPELPYLVSAALRQRLDLVHHLLEFGNRIVLIEGDAGSGRTRMLESACAEADAGWTVMQPEAGTIDSTASLLRFAGTGLGLGADEAGPGGPEFEGELIRVLERMHADHALALIAIDDADDLSDDVLDTLFRLAHSAQGTGHLRVVLTADRVSGLMQRIQERTPEPALVHLVDVPVLSTSQIGELADVFPRTGGGPPDPEALAMRTGGNPARVIAALAAAAARPAVPGPAGDRRLSPPALGALVVAAAAVIALIATFTLLRGSPPATSVETFEVSLPPQPGAPVAASPDEAGKVDRERAAEPDPQAIDVTVENDGPTDARPDSAQPPLLTAETPPAPEPAPATVAGAQPGAGAVEAPVPHDQPGVGPDEAESSPASAPAPNAGTSGHPPESPAAPGVPTPSPVAEPASPPAPAAPAPPVPVPASRPVTGVYSAQWVLTQSPRSYVIQLFGVRERAAAVRFLREQAGVMPGAIIELTHENAPWYVVIVGHYRNRADALAAISELPPSLSRFRPWARPVHSLKP